MQAVNNNVQGVASDPIIFEVQLNVPAKATSTEPFSLPVNEEAITAATGDSAKSRASGNRRPSLT